MTTRLCTPARVMAILLVSSAGAFAEEPDGSPPAQPEGPTVTLPETLKLSRLVDLAGEVSGQAYSYNPSELDSMVTLRIPGGLLAPAIPELLNHILSSRGLTTVRTPGSPLVSIVKLEQAAGMAGLRSSAGQEGRQESDGTEAFATEVYVPQHRNSKELADAIKGLLSKPGGTAWPLGDFNALVISDLTPRLRDVRSLLNRLDVPDATVLREVPLHHVTPAQAALLLSQMATKREAAGGRKLAGEVLPSSAGDSLLLLCQPDTVPEWLALISMVDRREPVETRTYTPQVFPPKDVARLVEATVGVAAGAGGTGAAAGGGVPGGDDRFRVVVDDLGGCLIVTGTPLQHERTGALLARLDAADRTQMPMRSFAVRNRPVDELLAVLNGLVAAGALSATPGPGRPDVTAGASQSNPRSTFAVPSSEPQAFPSPPLTNRPSASAAPAGGTRPGAMPALSLTADTATNTLIAIGEPRILGQLEALLEALDVRQPQVMLEAVLVSLTDTEALNLGVELERLQELGDTTLKLSSLFGLSAGGPLVGTAPAGAGLTGVVLNPGEFGAVVRALESLNEGRSLSKPRLLVTNNERAVFSSVLQQPITQQTRTGTNDQVFSYGGSESAGTTISVRPQIARGDHLVLTYSIKLSSFVGSSTAAGLPPPKQENSVDSIATIPDGHTVVVGGLELVSESSGESRVPILGSIPVLGELFKQRADGKGRTRFYAFIRASVLRSSSFEDMKHLSSLATDQAGVPDGWPEVEPRVIR